MLDDTECEYLSFKSPPNTVTSAFQSQITHTNRNVYSINCNAKPQNGHNKPSQLSKQKNVITPKSKDLYQSGLKTPRSNCEVISFSTDSTKKNQIQSNSHRKQPSIPTQFSINQNLLQQQTQGRLVKAKSNIEFFKTNEKTEKDKSLSKKLIQEIMEQVPLKYSKEFKSNFNKFDRENLSSLIETLKHYEEKIQRLQKEILTKNARIKSLENEKLHSNINAENEKIESYLKPENRYIDEENKQSIRRLLNMLKQTEEYKEFARFALDDNGIILLTEANTTKKTKLDYQNGQTTKKLVKLHNCCCNKQFIPQSYLWVPDSIYEHGKQFLKSHQDEQGKLKGFMSKSQYELLLYELNRMWREREKRIVNTITHEKNLQIDKLKRKYNSHGDRLNSAKKSNF